MNKKGQTLVAFIVLLPLLLIFMAIIIDVSYCYKEKTKLENVTENILKNNFKDKDNELIISKIKDLYKKNDIDNKNVKVVVNDNLLLIDNSYKINSIFGAVIGIKKYDIKVNMSAHYDGKLVITKE